MTALRPLALFSTIIVLIAATNMHIHAQQASSGSQAASIVVSIALDKDHVPLGQSPWAILTVKNLTDHDVALHDSMIRLHVEDEKGERPMTRVQRNATGKLQPEEAPLRPDEYAVWTIAPGESSSHKYELLYFYDLSTPGKYKAYMDVVDPSSRKRLRTNTVTFEIEGPDK